MLQIQDNYNKKIAPFSFDKINNVNIPVNINVSMSVIDIIKIAEVSHDDYGAGGGGDSDGCVMVDNVSMINIWLVFEKVKAVKIIQYQVDHTYTLKYRLILEWWACQEFSTFVTK